MSRLLADAPHADITYRIVGAAIAVHNDLGPGHREEVYHNALRQRMPQPPFHLGLEETGLPVYDAQGALVYVYQPDFLIERAVIVEIKAQSHPLTNDDLAQVLDYFAASELSVALLINFGRPQKDFPGES